MFGFANENYEDCCEVTTNYTFTNGTTTSTQTNTGIAANQLTSATCVTGGPFNCYYADAEPYETIVFDKK